MWTDSLIQTRQNLKLLDCLFLDLVVHYDLFTWDCYYGVGNAKMYLCFLYFIYMYKK